MQAAAAAQQAAAQAGQKNDAPADAQAQQQAQQQVAQAQNTLRGVDQMAQPAAPIRRNKPLSPDKIRNNNSSSCTGSGRAASG